VGTVPNEQIVRLLLGNVQLVYFVIACRGLTRPLGYPWVYTVHDEDICLPRAFGGRTHKTMDINEMSKSITFRKGANVFIVHTRQSVYDFRFATFTASHACLSACLPACPSFILCVEPEALA
jgi:hypothetical protein